MERVIGCDISHWQGSVNFRRMREAGALFVFIKASQAEWTDKRFAANYRAARDAGLIVGMYHYLDWTKPAVRQARHFAKLVSDYPPDTEPALDFEERRGAPERSDTMRAALDFINEVIALTGRTTTLLYTSPGYWREFGHAQSALGVMPLWIAHYNVAAPYVPAPWQAWLYWQYTDKGNGLRYGVESMQIDLNWFNGHEADFLSRYTGGTMPEEKPRPHLTAITAVNIRKAPTRIAESVGILRPSDRVEITSIHIESPRRVWARHEAGWSAIIYDDAILMK